MDMLPILGFDLDDRSGIPQASTLQWPWCSSSGSSINQTLNVTQLFKLDMVSKLVLRYFAKYSPVNHH
ncbi:hypothetical protein JTE90_012754 [Oedothorax gibbosus]|uniref:Uncharacterized protein n=1 Tax=Oedothorax gibbosus TaxID=931172 RepID=A0AAV6VYF9_9ARAC|nr:hypothetical protein JTE90_012754 [Oedothorax gibbosus]